MIARDPHHLPLLFLGQISGRPIRLSLCPAGENEMSALRPLETMMALTSLAGTRRAANLRQDDKLLPRLFVEAAAVFLTMPRSLISQGKSKHTGVLLVSQGRIG